MFAAHVTQTVLQSVLFILLLLPDHNVLPGMSGRNKSGSMKSQNNEKIMLIEPEVMNDKGDIVILTFCLRRTKSDAIK